MSDKEKNTVESIEGFSEETSKLITSDKRLDVFNYSPHPVYLVIRYTDGIVETGANVAENSKSNHGEYILRQVKISSIIYNGISRICLTGPVNDALTNNPTYFIHNSNPGTGDTISVVAVETSNE